MNLFTQGGNDFRHGSFFIIWLFCPRLLRPFCFFRASEALFRQTYLLQVVTIFDKDHFSFYVFFLTAEASDALLSRSLMIWQNKTMFWYRGRWTQIGYLKKWNSAYLHKCILINVIKWCLSKIWVPNQCQTLCYSVYKWHLWESFASVDSI